MMNILDILGKKAVSVHLNATTKDDAIKELVELLVSS